MMYNDKATKHQPKVHQSYDDFSEVVVIGYICSEQNLDVGALGFFFYFFGIFLEITIDIGE